MSALDMLNDPITGGMSGGTSIKGGNAAPSRAESYGGHAVTGAFTVGGAAISGTNVLAWAQSMAPYAVALVITWLVFRRK